MKNIIIVDMQKGFINDNNSHLIEKINKHLKDNTFQNVIYTKCVYSQTSPFVKILNWHGMKHTEEQQIVVDILNNATILKKEGYGLTQEDVSLIKSKGITEIQICGTDIDACVLAIAFNLFDNGIKPIILKDLCASSSKDNTMYDVALKIMTRQFGS